MTILPTTIQNLFLCQRLNSNGLQYNQAQRHKPYLCHHLNLWQTKNKNNRKGNRNWWKLVPHWGQTQNWGEVKLIPVCTQLLSLDDYISLPLISKCELHRVAYMYMYSVSCDMWRFFRVLVLIPFIVFWYGLFYNYWFCVDSCIWVMGYGV